MKQKVVDWLRGQKPLFLALAAVGAQKLFGINLGTPLWVTGAVVYGVTLGAMLARAAADDIDIVGKRLHNLEKRIAWIQKEDYHPESFARDYVATWPAGSTTLYCLFSRGGTQRWTRFDELPLFLISKFQGQYRLWTDLSGAPVADTDGVPIQRYDYKTRVMEGTRDECLAHVDEAAPDHITSRQAVMFVDFY